MTTLQKLALYDWQNKRLREEAAGGGSQMPLRYGGQKAEMSKQTKSMVSRASAELARRHVVSLAAMTSEE